jgi:hypothetical protein
MNNFIKYMVRPFVGAALITVAIMIITRIIELAPQMLEAYYQMLYAQISENPNIMIVYGFGFLLFALMVKWAREYL